MISDRVLIRSAIATLVLSLSQLWFGELLGGWVTGARSAAASGATQASAALLAGGWMLPALMIGVWLVLAPVAIYLAVAED